jgi:FAD/FMN-containing dehydrogenase
LGVIVEAELDIVPNTRVMRINVKLRTADYLEYFRSRVRDDRDAVFHNADLYPPHFTRLRVVTWIRTDRQPDDARRLMSPRDGYPLHRYLLWAITETPFGKWRRERIVDPILYCTSPVHWRNYEAGYDVAELEPVSRARRTYVLQEYFVPVARFDEFVPRMAEILERHRVNVINVSVRHALPDLGSLLSWAREEMFAFVLYYKQRVRRNARERVAVWTRELIEAAIAAGGTYYLPYQVHATAEQFHRAYPRARELFGLKRRYDPGYRFRGALWDAYYGPTVATAASEKPMPASGSDFHAVCDTAVSQDAF